jgi:chemotaxis signal transduction protein
MARILLADDTETYLALERRILGPNHEYFLARNGQQAISLARTVTPDVILMDFSMPLMRGDEAIGILRDDPSTSAIPVIAVTAEHSQEGAAQALGCADFIRKPFNELAFATRVTRILNTSHAARAAMLVRVSGQLLAIPLDAVREVVPMPALSQLPGAPRHIRGLLNLRGELIPVFDLMARLNLTAAVHPEDQLLLVCEQEGQAIGLCVDDAEEVVEISRGEFAPLDPAVAATFGSLSRAFLGGWKRAENLIPLLAPLRLLPPSALQQLGEII